MRDLSPALRIASPGVVQARCLIDASA